MWREHTQATRGTVQLRDKPRVDMDVTLSWKMLHIAFSACCHLLHVCGVQRPLFACPARSLAFCWLLFSGSCAPASWDCACLLWLQIRGRGAEGRASDPLAQHSKSLLNLPLPFGPQPCTCPPLHLSWMAVTLNAVHLPKQLRLRNCTAHTAAVALHLHRPPPHTHTHTHRV
jgi:hypothetical protein